jgi:hypothetical protein
MVRVFSPFTQSGRFALMLAVQLIFTNGASAQDHDRDHERRGGPTLVAPANGAVVDHDVIVRIGFAGGGGPRGPAEGTGIGMDGQPPGPDSAPPPRPDMGDHGGPSDGTGLPPNGDRRQRGPHFVLVVDSPALDSGSAFHADAQHIAFPAGIPQMTVSLPPGQHKLVLQTLDHDGASILQRRPPEAVTITVR